MDFTKYHYRRHVHLQNVYNYFLYDCYKNIYFHLHRIELEPPQNARFECITAVVTAMNECM